MWMPSHAYFIVIQDTSLYEEFADLFLDQHVLNQHIFLNAICVFEMVL